MQKGNTAQTESSTLAEVAEVLRGLDRVAVTTHVGADGDAIGSSAALLGLLEKLGVEAVFCHEEDVPNYLRWMIPEQERQLPEGYGLITLDTSRADRTGVPIPDSGATLNIDHHADNPGYARTNYVDGAAAATAEIVARLFAELGVELDKRAAEAVYTGIRTDTGGFRYRNISPETHELAADLLRAGVVPAEVDDRINRTGTIEQLRVVGATLQNAERYGEVIVATVDDEDYRRTGGTELDSKEAIDALRTVAGVDVVAHLRQVPKGTKGSLRSEKFDVQEIAQGFGGGGHRLAAGFTLEGLTPEEAKEKLLGALRGRLDLGEKR
ncbi:Exopolyphosphatase-related protein [Rubrobacter radiotolerans]|uniref:Bifunctional oligoribonuclease/PAP phosphatase NrnA n=1 Tax=Rubrobacter radiotolerans TaxID=42256 RepID=A0A023X2L1_RUBRA|nr:bifunctional oligoribonuclease/PAP phosphatase NrnA [Rubrobacter radiotolerans]AHY46702.1 Exopolyphosphatase-related protein [Rubrobacter radiotolerans]MDX5894109.1 bifunctional oligoribonuclease/PAP phosphatase NrnA [Rubrobacter radiotolerans]SMC05226.1 phosphoesterase RecJ domain-containing protein [Rubrobacter radiotolerans DSM 5868]